MFSYYGSKSKIIDKYPAPIYDTIVEPFAGSARYALKYWDKNVILIDKYEVIVKIWKYLQNASPKDIAALPELEKGEKLPDWLCEEEKALMGFTINRGNAQPCLTVNNWCNIPRFKAQVLLNLHKIKHWKIRHGSYQELGERERSTIFVDPPYMLKGYKYKHKNVDYQHLGQWCKDLASKNQLIVCENLGADWLDFKPLCEVQGQKKKSIEAIWTNENS